MISPFSSTFASRRRCLRTSALLAVLVLTGAVSLRAEAAEEKKEQEEPAKKDEASSGEKGWLRLEVYRKINGKEISTLTGHERFPLKPDETSKLEKFEIPANSGDNYGSRVTGLLVPKQSGKYTFWITGDDKVTLHLSHGDNPAGLRRICHIWGATGPREWDKHKHGQKSRPIDLKAGQRYYIEALQKEQGGNDHLAVTWQGPGVKKGEPIGAEFFAPLPEGKDWQIPRSAKDFKGTDIGYPKKTGRMRRLDDGKIFAVDGGGTDIWGKQCQFHFAHCSLDGDGTITAKVIGLQPTDPWAKAGVMMRDRMTPDAVNAYMAISVENGLTFQWRNSAGKDSESEKWPNRHYPQWLRLKREGDTFTGYASADGEAWDEIGKQTLKMGKSISVGLAVTSHNNETYCAAEFENVKVE